MADIFLKWEEIDKNWEEVFLLWEAVILEEAASGLGGGSGDGISLPRRNPWEEVEKRLKPELARKFLAILLKVNGKQFIEQREITDKKKITLKQIQNTFDHYGLTKIKVKAEVKNRSKNA